MNQKTAAIYDYLDENGNLLHQTVRYEPKDFRQRRPDGNGNCIWGLRAGWHRQGIDNNWRRIKNANSQSEKPTPDAVWFDEVRESLNKIVLRILLTKISIESTTGFKMKAQM